MTKAVFKRFAGLLAPERYKLPQETRKPRKTQIYCKIKNIRSIWQFISTRR